jgi:hypothetical protein
MTWLLMGGAILFDLARINAGAATVILTLMTSMTSFMVRGSGD